jgi:hypothetical protein
MPGTNDWRTMERMCELVSLDDVEQLYDIKDALESRGVYAEVQGAQLGGWRRARARQTQRLVVRQRDLVYARWVAAAAGIDTWPDDADESRRQADEVEQPQEQEAA